MTNDEFKYWLSGYLFLTDDLKLDKQQFHIIKNHANLVEAISGSLNPNINNFIAILDNWMKEKHTVPIFDVKQQALEHDCLINALQPVSTPCVSKPTGSCSGKPS